MDKLSTCPPIFVVSVIACQFKYAVCDKVFSGAVAFYNGTHHILWNIIVVGKKLLGVFWKTVTAITKGRKNNRN